MRRFSILFALVAFAVAASCRQEQTTAGEFLFVWAGDSAEQASDFLAVVDANPASTAYGAVVTSIPTGTVGSHPHHTEVALASSGHLLANGFHAGRSWLFDLTTPRAPTILTSFGDLAGFSHPHTYVRLSNGNVLATFQYAADAAMPNHASMSMSGEHATGGLVEMTEQGVVVRSGSAADTTIRDRRIYPYSVVELPGADRFVSTTTDMDHADTVATAEWVQFWRASDLTLLQSIALPPGPRGDEHRLTGEPHVLPDGKSLYIHTFSCGLYLIRDADSAKPQSQFVKSFPGFGCGVPILTGHFWLQPVPDTQSLVVLDIADPAHPREVSSLSFGDDESPHWIAIDPTGKRIVLNSGGSVSNRLFMIDFDPSSGKVSLDERFRDAGSTRAGVRMTGKTWPHGFTGTALPHGTVFSR